MPAKAPYLAAATRAEVPEKAPYSGVSTSIKAHNFARLLRGPLSILVACNSKLDLFSLNTVS